ncbi:hypothetical protein M5D96_013939, partial [Drosophila gunungcola]
SSNYFDDIEAALLEAEKLVSAAKTWRIGDKCQAKWKEDRQYYDATIEDVTSKGEVKVIFDAYQNRSTTHVHELRERTTRNEASQAQSKRIFKKTKAKKKQQRFKNLEENENQKKINGLIFPLKLRKNWTESEKYICLSG